MIEQINFKVFPREANEGDTFEFNGRTYVYLKDRQTWKDIDIEEFKINNRYVLNYWSTDNSMELPYILSIREYIYGE